MLFDEIENGWTDLASFCFKMFVSVLIRFLWREKLVVFPGKLKKLKVLFLWDFLMNSQDYNLTGQRLSV